MGELFDEVMVDDMTKWYSHECMSCGYWWMGGADFLICPECGLLFIGVGGVPEGTLSVNGGNEDAGR